MKERWTVRKRWQRWEVSVPAGTVASISFIAPFSTYERALSYVRYWIDRRPFSQWQWSTE